MKPIYFWFFIGSTDTYLTAMRLHDVAERTRASFPVRKDNF